MAADLVELAEDFLEAKRQRSGHEPGSSSDRARRTDLATWGRTLAMFSQVDTTDLPETRDLARDLGLVGLDDLRPDLLVRSLDALKAHYAPSTASRMATTMRTFCRWLVKKGHLPHDPIDDDEFYVQPQSRRASGRVVDTDGVAANNVLLHAFDGDQIERLLDAAVTPPENSRAAWPTRDKAMMLVLESTGIRAAECIGLQVGSVDTKLDTPMLRVVRNTKGNKPRDIPLSGRALAATNVYLDERRARAHDDGRLAFKAASDLWVRVNGAAMTTHTLDHMIRRCAEQAGVTLPDKTAAHGFRHHFGVELARRGVPLPVIQEAMGHTDPRTTAIYTKAVGRHLVSALEDAGWL